MTEEITVTHRLGVKKITVEGCSHANIVEWVGAGDKIENFIGGFDVAISVIVDEVPDTFPQYDKVKLIDEEYEQEVVTFDEETGEEIVTMVTAIRSVPELNEEGETVMVPKTWGEYVGNCYHPSTTTGKVVIPLGVRNSHGNRHSAIGSDEFYMWVDHFGLTDLLTKSEYSERILKEETESI